MKILITERQKNLILKDKINRLVRRSIDIDKVIGIVNYQTEIQDPYNFEDSDDYANFCISKGVELYYEDYSDDPENMDNISTYEMESVYYELEEVITEIMYDDLVKIYDDNI